MRERETIACSRELGEYVLVCVMRVNNEVVIVSCFQQAFKWLVVINIGGFDWQRMGQLQ